MNIGHKVSKYEFKYKNTKDESKRKVYKHKITSYKKKIMEGGGILQDALTLLQNPTTTLTVDKATRGLSNTLEPRMLVTFGTDHRFVPRVEKLNLLKTLLKLSADATNFTPILDISYLGEGYHPVDDDDLFELINQFIKKQGLYFKAFIARKTCFTEEQFDKLELPRTLLVLNLGGCDYRYDSNYIKERFPLLEEFQIAKIIINGSSLENFPNTLKKISFTADGKISVDLSPLEKYPNLYMIGDSFLSNFVRTVDLGPLIKIRAIGNSFLNKTHMTSIDLNGLSNVIVVGSGFLRHSQYLLSLDLSVLVSLVIIGDNFLEDCKSLTNLTFNGLSNVVTIGNYFLTNCHELLDLDLNGLTKLAVIGDNFLHGCNKLTNIKITGLLPHIKENIKSQIRNNPSLNQNIEIID